MKVFIDTNVWLAGRFWPGLCAELLDALVELDAEILLDEQVIEEFRKIARDKLAVEPELITQAEAFFAQYARILPRAEQEVSGIPDPEDATIIAAALGARADWFVTGDQALLELGRVQDMPIVSVREAYLKLRGLV